MPYLMTEDPSLPKQVELTLSAFRNGVRVPYLQTEDSLLTEQVAHVLHVLLILGTLVANRVKETTKT